MIAHPVPLLLVLTAVLVLVLDAVEAKVEHPKLPYKYDALEKFIGRQTLEIHHGKHHAKYVDTTNQLIKNDKKLKSASLEEIMDASYEKHPVLYNNAAQAWNHAFYWKCMKEGGGGKPDGHKILMELIESSFGDYDKFDEMFEMVANTAFGSGWAWLVYDKSEKKLKVMSTTGAENPYQVSPNGVPILTIDTWEHAYYLDFQNRRPEYVSAFMKNLVNWDFVAKNLDAAIGDDGTKSEEL